MPYECHCLLKATGGSPDVVHLIIHATSVSYNVQIIHLCENAEIRAVLPFLDSETKVAEKLTILRSDDYFQTYIKVNREVNNAAI